MGGGGGRGRAARGGYVREGESREMGIRTHLALRSVNRPRSRTHVAQYPLCDPAKLAKPTYTKLSQSTVLPCAPASSRLGLAVASPSRTLHSLPSTESKCRFRSLVCSASPERSTKRHCGGLQATKPVYGEDLCEEDYVLEDIPRWFSEPHMNLLDCAIYFKHVRWTGIIMFGDEDLRVRGIESRRAREKLLHRFAVIRSQKGLPGPASSAALVSFGSPTVRAFESTRESPPIADRHT
ncbi:hypothetical protein BOTBODRAFT_377747 [Botryobasidium botryosum FD-172 SS1]|uniref:SAM domain-containing protein n=1 Tax=Botryobasidium botryosum (strain FD-172 SS1) TaxID=930990 RepID=A0A067MYN1_BOTB1|nr:hypothetical protein BOTBODRAFT_377747 [Botryobasidium botryosum FD-172 SS1]